MYSMTNDKEVHTDMNRLITNQTLHCSKFHKPFVHRTLPPSYLHLHHHCTLPHHHNSLHTSPCIIPRPHCTPPPHSRLAAIRQVIHCLFSNLLSLPSVPSVLMPLARLDLVSVVLIPCTLPIKKCPLPFSLPSFLPLQIGAFLYGGTILPECCPGKTKRQDARNVMEVGVAIQRG